MRFLIVSEHGPRRRLRGLHDCEDLAKEVQAARPLRMPDREGDVYGALFSEQQYLGHVDLLAQAKHNRALAGGGSKLFDEPR